MARLAQDTLDLTINGVPVEVPLSDIDGLLRHANDILLDEANDAGDDNAAFGALWGALKVALRTLHMPLRFFMRFSPESQQFLPPMPELKRRQDITEWFSNYVIDIVLSLLKRFGCDLSVDLEMTEDGFIPRVVGWRFRPSRAMLTRGLPAPQPAERTPTPEDNYVESAGADC